MSTAPRHFVAVWNPSYVSDALEAHLTLLLARARHARTERETDDDVYVWWGKVRSPNRQQPLAHLDECLTIGRSLVEPLQGEATDEVPPETHLYLTDYRTLYVADIDFISTENVAERDSDHVPAYYARESLSCDLWWRIRDMRLLVSEDLHGVIEELKSLRNTHYNDRPVSLYGGMVDLPLIVTRPDGRHYFDEDERERLADGRLWAEFDAEQAGGVGATERDLRENRFGDALWGALDPATRRFVSTAERTFRDHRTDAAYDFAPVMTAFGKALEVQSNLSLRRALARAAPEERRANLDGRTVDLVEFRALSLGELARVIGGERSIATALVRLLENGRWFAESLPVILDDFATNVRNPGAHSTRIDRETARRWRDRLVGVGSVGDLVELARVKPVAR